MRIYTCHHCENGDHAKCERTHSAPPGHYGGSKCDCPCDGDVNFREKLEKQQEDEMRRVMDFLAKHTHTP